MPALELPEGLVELLEGLLLLLPVVKVRPSRQELMRVVLATSLTWGMRGMKVMRIMCVYANNSILVDMTVFLP